MVQFASSLAAVAFGFLVAFACGYGVVEFLLPREPRELRPFAAPTVGYVAFSLLVMVISGNFALGLRLAVPIAFALLLALSAVALVRRRRAGEAGALRATAITAAAVLVPTLLVIVGPMLVQGIEYYLGSVNLDFFQSMVYEDVLSRKDLPVFAQYALPTGAHSLELATKAWPESLQARFGAVMFAYLLKWLAGFSTKSSLTVAMGVFALCVPLSVHVFARVVTGLEARTAALAAMLAGISAPLTMSFLYVLVGQSSGLPVLPLLVTVLFLTLRAPGVRLVACSAVLIWGLFWVYALMLPFALAPMGLLAAWLLLRRRLSIRGAAAIIAGLVIALVIAWGGMPGQLAAFLRGIASISGHLAGTVFFVDFLTELFFVYFFGATTYTFSNSLVFLGLGSLLPGGAAAWGVAVAVAAGLFVFVAAAFAAWRRQEPSGERRMAIVALLAVYSAVWAWFTFARPYGYSAFKMAVWLQFAALPLLAFGIVHFWSPAGGKPTRARRALAAGVALVLVATNLAGAIDYDRMSFGTNRERGYIVNAFGVGDNPEWATLGADVAAHVRPTQTVGIAFTDAIQNDWAAYRLTGVASHSILSHEQLPEDDSFLPDPVTGATSDTAGTQKSLAPLGVDDVRNDFFLLPGARNLNPEIIDQALPPPVWEDGTFRLQANGTLRDFLFLGRGFYRAGFPSERKPWWEPPGASRWMRDGGEFYLYQAAHPGEPYRLAFTAMAGFGYPSASRTLEFWHGGRKFDEIVLTDVGRIVSKPFPAAAGVDRVTVVIRERTRPFPRPLGLWNRGVPEDTRNLNLYVSAVHLLRPGEDEAPARAPARLQGAREILEGAAYFNGISAGGWLNESASLGLAVPFDAPRLALRVMVPGNLGYAFPYRIRIAVDGVQHDYVAERAGEQVIELDLAQAHARQLVRLDLAPAEHRKVDDAFSNRIRPIVQSILLQSVEFHPR